MPDLNITQAAEFAKPLMDTLVAFGIAGLALAISAAWIFQLYKFNRQLAFGLAGAVLMIAGSAYLSDRFGWFLNPQDLPPRFFVLALPTLVFFIFLGLGRYGTQMASNMTVTSLIALQVFRFPLELLMWRAALLQVMPIEFSLQGYSTGPSLESLVFLLSKCGISLASPVFL
jgi:hypothetical protein